MYFIKKEALANRRVKTVTENLRMSVFLTTLAAVVTVYVFIYYHIFKCSRRCESTVKLRGKTAIVTGNPFLCYSILEQIVHPIDPLDKLLKM